MRTSPLLLAAGLLVVALAGCTTAPQPVASPTASGPPSFPRVAGTVLSTTESAPDDWVITVQVKDPPAAYRAARSLLTGAGYQLTLDEPVTDGGNGQACTTAQCVGFSAITRPTVGPTIQYEVFHSTGLAG